MGSGMAINLGLALIALIALIALLLILVLKELHNLGSLLEHSDVPTPPKVEYYQPSLNQEISEAEVAAIVAVIAKIMPEQKITSIRVQG